MQSTNEGTNQRDYEDHGQNKESFPLKALWKGYNFILVQVFSYYQGKKDTTIYCIIWKVGPEYAVVPTPAAWTQEIGEGRVTVQHKWILLHDLNLWFGKKMNISQKYMTGTLDPSHIQ